MTSKDALREFAEGIMKSHETWGKPLNDKWREEGIEEIMERTTAFITEHYYPKEEIVNAVCPSCESDNCVLIAVPRNRCKDCGVEWDKENER